MTDLHIAVMGAGGKMGRALVRAVHEAPGCQLVGGTEARGSALIGTDLGELAGVGPIGLHIVDDPLNLFTRAEAIIDFTVPSATVEHAMLAAQARIVHVIGTTGLSAQHERQIEAARPHATIIKAGNMSLGVNLLVGLTRKVAAALDDDFDIEIVEMHHRHKIDAPSGTALMLGEAAAAGRRVALDGHSVRARDGETGPRPRGAIGFASLRGGDVVGDHTVVFASAGERIELTHRATDRQIFARGAVKAALWGHGKPPGIYSMLDVLGLGD
jgi:4-hydroxy-tetrahydrodipicolinate reductase